MILTTHLLVGAAIASKTKFLPLPLSLLLAFLSHYLLDALPHREYSVKNIKRKIWKKSLSDFLKVFLDVFIGSFILLALSKNLLLALAGGLFAILPDGLILLGLLFPNRLLKLHSNFHQKMHFPKDKKIPIFWGIFSEVLVSIVAIYTLL